jgi:hypothetical protein
MVKLLLGNFTFLDEEIDGKLKCIIHIIDGVIYCNSEDQAYEIGENLLEYYESYLVLPTYKGEIEFGEKFNTLFNEIFNHLKQ